MNIHTAAYFHLSLLGSKLHELINGKFVIGNKSYTGYGEVKKNFKNLALNINMWQRKARSDPENSLKVCWDDVPHPDDVW